LWTETCKSCQWHHMHFPHPVVLILFFSGLRTALFWKLIVGVRKFSFWSLSHPDSQLLENTAFLQSVFKTVNSVFRVQKQFNSVKTGSANPTGLPLANDTGGCAWLLMSLGRVFCFLIRIVFCHVEKLVTILFYDVIASVVRVLCHSESDQVTVTARKVGGVWLTIFQMHCPFLGKIMPKARNNNAKSKKNHAKTLPE